MRLGCKEKRTKDTYSSKDLECKRINRKISSIKPNRVNLKLSMNQDRQNQRGSLEGTSRTDSLWKIKLVCVCLCLCVQSGGLERPEQLYYMPI